MIAHSKGSGATIRQSIDYSPGALIRPQYGCLRRRLGRMVFPHLDPQIWWVMMVLVLVSQALERRQLTVLQIQLLVLAGTAELLIELSKTDPSQITPKTE